jgi:succinylarginine dihydrolase
VNPPPGVTPHWGAYGGIGVTNHAIRRFRRRVQKLPRRAVEKILVNFLATADVREGQAIFDWQGRPVSLVIRGGTVVTVYPGPRWPE